MYDPTQSRYRYLDFIDRGIQPRYINKEKEPEQKAFDLVDENTPAHGPYGPLLFRKEWKEKRNEIIHRDKYCVICNDSHGLQIHHRQYHFLVRERRFRNPWEYPHHLMITLCESCHRRGHAKFKVPTINL